MYSGSEALTDLFASQGTSLQDFFTAQGIADINNIPVTTFFDSPELFTIFSISGNTLSIGLDSPSFDGSTAALRHDTLDPDIYTRVGAGPVTPPVQIDNPGQSDSRIIGIAFDQGDSELFFDFATGLSLVRLVGGGAYVILNDDTAILTSVAPVDLDVDQALSDPETTTFSALGLSDNNFFQPLPEGFTFNFTGSNNTPGVGGATLRSLTFRNDGTFSQTGTAFFSSGGLNEVNGASSCLLYTSPSPRDRTRTRMPSSA